MGEHLREALGASMRRIDTITEANGTPMVSDEQLALAFMGLDTDPKELAAVQEAASEPYADLIITMIGRQLEYVITNRDELTFLDTYALGREMGDVVRSALAGNWSFGCLTGELHREQTLKREAASDDDS